jgi:serine/threonine protein kinase
MTLSHDDADARVGQTLGKKFLLRALLGAGGMGAVYEAEHLLTKRVGALKLLHLGAAERPELVQRFLREASAAGRIGSPHIVETIDAGELPSGEPYLFMELLSGSPVSALIERHERLTFVQAREIALQAAEGLQAAHDAGIVHRDVKPDNQFLVEGPGARLKLLDFGISKFSEPTDYRLTREGTPLGTPYYMSPEQVAGKRDVGPASDIYSLGVVLYECVTGRVPFDADTLPALSLKIFAGDYLPPSSVTGPGVPGLDAVIARAMARAPSERYASMTEFRRALLELGTEPSSLFGATVASDPPAPRLLSPSGAPARQPTFDDSAQSRPRRWAWVLTSLVVVCAGAAWLWHGARAQPRPDDFHSLTSAPTASAAPAPSASLRAEPKPAPSAAPETAPEAGTPPVASSAPDSPRRRAAPLASTHPTVSKAARDGLSEQNPFAE